MEFRTLSESKYIGSHFRIIPTVSAYSYDLQRLNEFGYRVGLRMLELLVWRDRNPKREVRVLSILYFIHTALWKGLFGKQADSLEKSTENEDECRSWSGPVLSPIQKCTNNLSLLVMISDNEPVLTKYISVPRELSQLNCNAFLAGVVEAILDSAQFVSWMRLCFCELILLAKTLMLLYSLLASQRTPYPLMDSH